MTSIASALSEGAANSVLRHFNQNDPSAQGDWQGRSIHYIMKNTLLAFGGVSLIIGVVCFSTTEVPVEIPVVALGVFAVIVTVVTCVGGCCLWGAIPNKTQAESINKLRNKIETLTTLERESNSSIKELTTRNNELTSSLNTNIEEIRDLRANMQAAVEKAQTSFRDLVGTVQQAGNNVTNSMEGFSSSSIVFSNAVGQLQEVANQFNAMRRLAELPDDEDSSVDVELVELRRNFANTFNLSGES